MARQPLIPALTARDARRMADWANELESYFSGMAGRETAIDKRNADDSAHLLDLSKAPDIILHYLEAGYSRSEAVDRLTRRMNVSRHHAWAISGLAIKRLNAGSKRRRNLLMVRLAGRGWTDKKIAQRVSLHPKSVNRILRRYLRPGT